MFTNHTYPSEQKVVLTSLHFFDAINRHYQNGLPFVAFRNPSETKITAFLQAKHTEKKDSYFLISPFSSENQPSRIYGDQILTSEYTSEVTNVDHVTIEWDKITDCRQEHIQLISSTIDTIAKTNLKKVVLATALEWNGVTKDFLAYFKTILSLYPNTFNYVLFHPECGIWMGATPECLFTMKGSSVSTMALAGTRVSGSNRWGKKELEEQNFVVSDITNTLLDFSDKNSLTLSEVETVQAGHLEHLRTTIKAQVTSSPFQLAKALHPTPAVGGVPKNSAVKFILKNESIDRSLYSGFLGIVSPNETNFYVNLRCMEILDNKAKVYVGGGITEKSSAVKEWEEVLQKANTMAKVLVS